VYLGLCKQLHQIMATQTPVLQQVDVDVHLLGLLPRAVRSRCDLHRARHLVHLSSGLDDLATWCRLLTWDETYPWCPFCYPWRGSRPSPPPSAPFRHRRRTWPHHRSAEQARGPTCRPMEDRGGWPRGTKPRLVGVPGQGCGEKNGSTCPAWKCARRAGEVVVWGSG